MLFQSCKQILLKTPNESSVFESRFFLRLLKIKDNIAYIFIHSNYCVMLQVDTYSWRGKQRFTAEEPAALTEEAAL